jgi:hypothetical protein
LCCNVATTERQLAETVKEEEELEQISKAAQVEEGNEHSEEWLKIFSQEAEKRRLQHWSLQQKKKKKQTTWILLICVRIGSPGEEG